MKILILLAGLALAACQSCHPIVGPFPEPAPQPEPPDPWGPSPDGATDAAPPPVTSCAAACAHLAALGCPESKPTPKGATCEAVCQNTLGSPISLQTDCVIRATTCADTNACQAIP